MRRPLACAGLLFLLVQLLAAFLPPAALGPLAALFVAGALGALVYRGRARGPALLFCCVCAAALLLHLAALRLYVGPLWQRAGQEGTVSASVRRRRPGYADGTVQAELLVERVEGRAVRPFRVYCAVFPDLPEGCTFTAKMRFCVPEADAYRNSRYAAGCFLAAEYEGGLVETGESRALWAGAARLRAWLCGRLQERLAQPYAGMAAALTIGDRMLLDSGVRETLSRAGLAHIAVVSGLHLSAVSGVLYALLRRKLRRRASAALAGAATVCFVVLAGASPSAVRAGVALLLYYGGEMLGCRSDGFTSLGAAALLLCMANPYAAVDTGFLLSVLATLGVLCVSQAQRRRRAHRKPPEGRLRALGVRFLWAAAVPLAASAATLPVLIAAGIGVSLLTVVCSLLVLPVLPAAIGLGFAAALVPAAGWLRVPCRVLGFLCTLLLRWILAVAAWAADVPFAFVHVSGLFALCVSALMCVLVWGAWHWRIRLRAAFACLLAFLVLCTAAYAAFDVGVVRIELVGGGAEPVVLLTEGLWTAVLFRGPVTRAGAVRDALEKYNRIGVDFLIDLRGEGDTETLARLLSAKESVSVRADVFNHAVFAPFGDVLFYVRRQAQGSLVCMEIHGRRVGVARGRVDLSGLPALDCFIAGSGEPQGLCCAALILPQARKAPWAQSCAARQYGRAEIVVRAGHSLKIKEKQDDPEWFGV